MTKNAELTHLFRAMKAPAAARALPNLAERARQEEWSYERFAEALLSTEISSPESSGGRLRIRAARFPAHKTLEEFDFTFQRSVKKQVIEHLGQLDFLHAKRERDPARPARSGFTLLLSRSSLCKESSLGLKDLDSQALAAAGGDVDGVSLFALDLVQHGLAGDAECLRGLVERQIAVGDVGNEACPGLVGEADPPRRVRRDLFAGEQSFAQPAADRRGGDVELLCGMLDRDRLAARVGGRCCRDPGALAGALDAGRGERQSCPGASLLAVEDRGDLGVGVMGGEAPHELDRVLVGAQALAAAADQTD